jgi:ribosome biogenesis GTPase
VASLRGRVKRESGVKLAVGDDVMLSRDEPGSGWSIAEILDRRSRLTRKEPGRARGERVIAANMDQVVVVFALRQPEPHVAMLDRFLVIAEANALSARVVVNKVDLAARAEARKLFATYETIGYPVHITSCRTGEGLPELREALLGRTSVITGPSGVGKSSLLNALYPGLGLRVGEISASVNKGRHTTVGAYLHPLPDGGFVVDTPGLREIGLWGVPSRGLDACFRNSGRCATVPFRRLQPSRGARLRRAGRARQRRSGRESLCVLRETSGRGSNRREVLARSENHRRGSHELSG